MTKKAGSAKPSKAPLQASPKKYLSQTDVPAWSLDQAIRIPRAITDEHAGKPTRPIDVAHAMNVQPSTGGFRTLCGAAIAYGLTEGGYNAEAISLTDLGRMICDKPIDDANGLAARREAVLKPRVVREFLQRYDGSKMPREEVALKVLEGLGVPGDAAKRAYELIIEAARTFRLLKDINGVQYIDLHHTRTPPKVSTQDEHEDQKSGLEYSPETAGEIHEIPAPEMKSTLAHAVGDPKDKRVFVSHGKKRDLVPQLKEFLEIADFEPVVSVERESVSKPVPDKIMDDMRSCSAAIIHVDSDRDVTDDRGEKEALLNENVLIEIGAALALYRRRFILLVRDGAKLPSNLQGLFEVRYNGGSMDAEAALRLLKSLRQLKAEPISRE